MQSTKAALLATTLITALSASSARASAPGEDQSWRFTPTLDLPRSHSQIQIPIGYVYRDLAPNIYLIKNDKGTAQFRVADLFEIRRFNLQILARIPSDSLLQRSTEAPDWIKTGATATGWNIHPVFDQATATRSLSVDIHLRNGNPEQLYDCLKFGAYGLVDITTLATPDNVQAATTGLQRLSNATSWNAGYAYSDYKESDTPKGILQVVNISNLMINMCTATGEMNLSEALTSTRAIASLIQKYDPASTMTEARSFLISAQVFNKVLAGKVKPDPNCQTRVGRAIDQLKHDVDSLDVIVPPVPAPPNTY